MTKRLEPLEAVEIRLQFHTYMNWVKPEKEIIVKYLLGKGYDVIEDFREWYGGPIHENPTMNLSPCEKCKGPIGSRTIIVTSDKERLCIPEYALGKNRFQMELDKITKRLNVDYAVMQKGRFFTPRARRSYRFMDKRSAKKIVEDLNEMARRYSAAHDSWGVY